MKQGPRNHVTPTLSKFNQKNYVTPTSSQQQVLEMKKAFDLIDRDGGGLIDLKQLKSYIIKCGMESRATAFFCMTIQLDLSSARTLDFQQFLQLMTKDHQRTLTRQYTSDIFKTFDAQCVGYISMKDLKRVAKQIGEYIDDDKLEEMIAMGEGDYQGLVCEEQFYTILTKKKY